ncbi:DNA-3-methyladenine glycosylase family protein [Knoellia subterranea]|uniref:DNA-3-methyladenine glycosylase II n=1 Tax=Knoellia subterranea KCTC 19937 TaxID=1385521 RepID=A0A0A0JKC2_9MICO|nr:DNA-3-methyladenine glycosylase [Knoellia subterranea]KGN37513.1 DNA-3-methyladenine glycosidase [Knoellia subterranea KCTC 19937]
MDQDAWERHVREAVALHPELAAELDHHGMPERWSRPPGFPSLVLLILEQQVSLASAAAAYARVRTRAGAMTPVALLATTPEELREDGVSRQKDRYLRALSAAVASGELDLVGLAEQSDAEVAAALTALPGIGRWTAEAYLLACLDRPDVWPVGDRALQVAVAETLGLEDVPIAAELEEIGERWRPHRSTAARLLWHGYLARRGRQETVVDLDA